jgi:hypothetical protein
MQGICAYIFVCVYLNGYRGEDNIRKDLRKIRWEGVDWIHLVQDTDQWRAVVNTVMILELE